MLELVIQRSDRYLKPSRTSLMELFRKNSKLLIAVYYFRKMFSSKMFGWVLNTPLKVFSKCQGTLLKKISLSRYLERLFKIRSTHRSFLSVFLNIQSNCSWRKSNVEEHFVFQSCILLVIA